MYKGVILLLSLFWVYLIVDRSKFFLHMLQLEGYGEQQYRRWLKSTNRAYTNILNKGLIATLV
ncbi:MAG TPA: UDP-N-acetylmuramoyl-tripeptide--D-alanyl-D-alanine ligase, partial [Tepidimicrobium sp.]|nr:UDP-N-acetylmuramoyl-tripeptide--D-alanyl-D-alanine ligase [Tepidimicrobium sp.]